MFLLTQTAEHVMFKMFKSLLPTNKEVVEEPKSIPALTATELRCKASKTKAEAISFAIQRLTTEIDELLVIRAEKGSCSGNITIYETDKGYVRRENKICNLTYITNDSDILTSVTSQYHEQYRKRGFTVETKTYEVGEQHDYQITTISW